MSYDPPQSPEKEAGSTLKRSPKSAKGTDDLDDKVCISKQRYFQFKSGSFLDAFPAPRDPKSADFSSSHLEF